MESQREEEEANEPGHPVRLTPELDSSLAALAVRRRHVLAESGSTHAVRNPAVLTCVATLEGSSARFCKLCSRTTSVAALQQAQRHLRSELEESDWGLVPEHQSTGGMNSIPRNAKSAIPTVALEYLSKRAQNGGPELPRLLHALESKLGRSPQY